VNSFHKGVMVPQMKGLKKLLRMLLGMITYHGVESEVRRDNYSRLFRGQDTIRGKAALSTIWKLGESRGEEHEKGRCGNLKSLEDRAKRRRPHDKRNQDQRRKGEKKEARLGKGTMTGEFRRNTRRRFEVVKR